MVTQLASRFSARKPCPRLLAPAVLSGIVLLGSAGVVQAQSNVQRVAASASTATNSADCKALPTFYWEVGDRSAKLASGTRGLVPPKASDQITIYSASKWLFGAYVYQRRGGQLSAGDIRYLNMTSGYTSTNQCLASNTVAACRDTMSGYSPASAGSFYYAAGHFQQFAVDLGLGSSTRAQLATAVRGVLGTDIALNYQQPQLASGAQMTTTAYGLFLRKILSGQLLLSGGALGSYPVCTYTSATSAQTGRTKCPTSLYSPTDNVIGSLEESWSYSLGHWVETDPLLGDGAFSSPGYAGFYPWIDASRSYYGIVARTDVQPGAAGASAKCGRLIRKAWLTGIAQP